jgi:hypothetical protein
VYGKVVRLFEDLAVYLCTGCKEQVHLDDAIIIHSDGIRCLCVRCLGRHVTRTPAPLTAAASRQIAEAAARGEPPDYDWPVW